MIKINSVKGGRVSVAIIIDSQDRFLLQKKDSGYSLGPNKWSLVGGNIEKDESEKDAIKRESREEIGIEFRDSEVRPYKKIMFKGRLNRTDVEMEHNIFIINFKANLSDVRVGEGAGFCFFEKRELASLNLILSSKQILEEFLK